MKNKSFPLKKVYQLLEPGPVVMVTTARNGKANIMTMSWYTMIDFNPPLLACVIDEHSHSFSLLKETKECVINIPTVDLVDAVVGVGNTSGVKVDKFKKFHLTPELATKVNVPLLGECYANLECIVVDMTMASAYNIFILKVVKAWTSSAKKRKRTIHHAGNGVFIVDGKMIKTASKKK